MRKNIAWTGHKSRFNESIRFIVNYVGPNQKKSYVDSIGSQRPAVKIPLSIINEV